MYGAGDTMLEADEVRKIGFTGSTAIGKQLMAGAANTVKKVRAAVLFFPSALMVQGQSHSKKAVYEDCAARTLYVFTRD